MDFDPLPFRSPLSQYQRQARNLLNGFRAGLPEAIQCARTRHPRFLRDDAAWLPKALTDAEVRNAAFEFADAQLTIARGHDFRDWAALTAWVEEVTRDNSPVQRFETAVEAVIAGDIHTLEECLQSNPELVRARSTRVTHFDPPEHRATLLHYVAANGVEGYRQKTPANAVEVAKTLLRAGAEVDALADMYGGHYTTMSMLVSSCHPANAGVQVALVGTLLDFGAAIEPRGSPTWGSPLMTALAFGYQDTAQALVRRGARVGNIAAAAGLGLTAEAARMLATADAESRRRAMALAAQHGHADIVRLLLDAGEDPNRYNPDGNHSHSTPLHQAALAGHEATVRVLVEGGANLDIRDRIHDGAPLDWAVYAGKAEVERYLRAHGSEPERVP
ncbi:MAG TPA: ankyrin repeat domain-containing protein [Bryobacteraceae bacterium]|nr:ankyrin repeat domain-containing protein [Bryobacteraceae bacterium]